MQEQAQQPYTPAELAALLHISVPTLRKYSLLIEKVTDNSHYFTRNQQNVRAYSEKDLRSLQKLAELSKAPNMTLQVAAEQIYRPAQTQIITGLKKKPLTNTQESNPTGNLIRQLVDELRTTQQQVRKLTARVTELENSQKSVPTKAAVDTAPTGTAMAAPVRSTGTSASARQNVAPQTRPAEQTTSATTPEVAATDVMTTNSQLKFTEPLPSDDPQAASDATHHLVYQDEPQPDDPGVKVYDKPHDLAAMQVPAEKKQSWWQKIRSK